MEKRALVVLADGFEEIEAVTVIDVLRRASIKVTVAGVTRHRDGLSYVGRSSLAICAELPIADIPDLEDIDALVLPGGMPGATHLAADIHVQRCLQRVNERKGVIGAICAAPAVVLAPAGLLRDREATCYPSFKDNLVKEGARYKEDAVVVDRAGATIITSRGPATAMEFSLSLVAELTSMETAAKIRHGLLA